jgi:hypothetical protein
MNSKYFLVTPFLLAVVYFLFVSSSGGTADSGNGNRTGSPGSSGTCANCHSGGSFGASISATVTDVNNNTVTSYIPGATYFVEFQVSSTSGTPKYGFQSVMLTGTNANAGNFDSVLTTNTQITTLSTRKLPEHSAKSTTGNFKVRWIAPGSGTGTVTLYYIGNAVNDNGSTSGDSPTTAQTLTLTEEPVFTASATQVSPVSCSGGNDGEASVSVINGTAPYTYQWSNGSSSGPVTSTSNSISGLIAGTYYVTVTDGNTSVSIDSVVISEPLPLAGMITWTDETCYQLADGTAQLSVSGGTAPYSYSWSNGATTSSISNLAPGVYMVTVSDGNNCTGVYTALVDSANQIVSNSMAINPNCVNSLDGSISVSPSGGMGSFSIIWSTGATSSSIGSLSIGNYSVTISDLSGCQITESFSLSSSNQPPGISFSPIEPTCFSSANGSILANVSGGMAPYMYGWSTGDSTLAITNLSTGMYYFGVVDAQGCVNYDSVDLGTPNILPVVDLGSDTVICDTSLGSFTISAGAPISGYTYLWNTLDTTNSITIFFSGSYSVVVSDSVGCASSDTIEIGETPCVTGIVDLFESNSVEVYPIPAENELVFNSPYQGDVEIFSVFGNRIAQFKVEQGNTVIDVSNWAKGTYFMYFKSANGNGIKKIVII